MRIRMMGRHWLLKFVPYLGQNIGLCEHPDEVEKTIRVQKGLPDKEKLRTILHELTHAGFWCLSEESVDEFSRDVAEVLWRLGYRESE